MFNRWEDYYKILQVHFLAEPEMINNAYRKLSKKHHPDLNKSPYAEEKMKAIIRAYEVLSDPTRRQQYFVKWVEKNSRFHTEKKERFSADHYDRLEVERIKTVFVDYLNCIIGKDYHSAFDMLSERDQKYIDKQDFIRWQELVSEVFELLKYDCQVRDIYSGLSMGESTYEKVASLKVRVLEKNHIMSLKEKDELSKSVVYENSHWSVYLGRKDLTTIIAKFNDLTKIKKRKKVFTFRSAHNIFHEDIPGVLCKSSFLERAEREQMRYNRYGNPFTVMVFELPRDTDLEIYRQMGIIMASHLRDLDFISRWKRRGFIVVLPETEASKAVLAANKLSKTLDEMFSCKPEFREHYSLKQTIAEQKHETFYELCQSLVQQEKKNAVI